MRRPTLSRLSPPSSLLPAAIIGAGVLGLPHAMAWLGWVAGVLLLVFFYLVTVLVSHLLADISNARGVRYANYRAAVEHILGAKACFIAGTFQFLNLVLSGMAYTISAGTCGRAVLVATGHMNADSEMWPIILVFGGIQVVLSQIPNLDALRWSSVIGAATSIAYSFIALVLCAIKAGDGEGTVAGVTGVSASAKAFGIMVALGDIAFAFNFASLLVEIQDTVMDPPCHKKVTKRAIDISLTISFLLFFLVAVLGYAAFGNNVPGQILSVPDIGPAWVIVFANVLVFVHMISAVQIFSQPVFAACELNLLRVMPQWWVDFGELPQRIIFRSLYIALITFIACLIPFFSDIIGLVGALVYWPLATCFPILLWLSCYPKSMRVKVLLQTLNVVVGCISAVAVIGSVRGIVTQASSYKLFQ
ncbi:transmembrane amino acid transporter protein [Helicosporidium sp. ATCC 50920]|nr:transmembrane amino acid transporter protein [Helicosporidium sp. ATCC 50920]|eukprot:KDD76072.1 transmembrane amino acid transporter protein [Helicosporidium sp. ATCC 50920]